MFVREKKLVLFRIKSGHCHHYSVSFQKPVQQKHILFQHILLLFLGILKIFQQSIFWHILFQHILLFCFQPHVLAEPYSCIFKIVVVNARTHRLQNRVVVLEYSLFKNYQSMFKIVEVNV